jgi:HrpA-like RNA helicase
VRRQKATRFRFELVSQNEDTSISHGNTVRIDQNGVNHDNIAMDHENSTTGLESAKNEVCQKSLVLTLPVRTVSEANNFEHWTKKHKRHTMQRQAVTLLLKPHRDKIKLPCHIKLTRVAPRKLDRWDNLPISMKYILDACCAIITGDYRPGRADDDERITVSYDQQTNSNYSVILEFVF